MSISTIEVCSLLFSEMCIPIAIETDMLPIIYRGHEDAGFFVHALTRTNGRPLVSILPGNARSACARYACVVAVRDYWRMISASAAREKCWHYSTGLEAEIVDDVRAGRAVIVFDLSNEGPDYWPVVFDELYGWIEKNHIPPGRVVWLAQNRAIADQAKVCGADRSQPIIFEYYDFFLKMVGWDFSPNGSVRHRIFGGASDDVIFGLLDPKSKDRILLCLNATPRLQRVLAVAALRYHKLADLSLVSFGGFEYAKTGVTLDAALQFSAANPKMGHLYPELSKLANLDRLVIDAFQEKGNALISKIEPESYRRTFFSLVTESDFSNGDIDRVTEKTAKAFCMGHPALLLGNPRSINFMMRLGFKDWETINRSYEQIDDPSDRFVALFAETVEQAAAVQADPEMWLHKNREISLWNISHAFGGGLLSRYVSLYDVPIVERLIKLVSQSDS